MKSLSGELPQDGTNLVQEFRTLALRYAEIGEKDGIKVIPFLSPEMPLFSKASVEERKRSIDLLRIMVSILEETLAGGDTVTDTRTLIWRALSRFSLVPGADIFDKFSKEDIVIIYNENHNAIFWNLQFFKFSSFTIEQMFFGIWPELTKREPHIQASLISLAQRLTSTSTTTVFDPKVPGHEVQEIGTLENIRTWMEVPWVAVLTRNGKFGGYLAVQRMKIIGRSNGL